MDDKEKERINTIYFRVARLMWAMVLLFAELHTGDKPNWKKRDSERRTYE